jgi:hypothetical protein
VLSFQIWLDLKLWLGLISWLQNSPQNQAKAKFSIMPIRFKAKPLSSQANFKPSSIEPNFLFFRPEQAKLKLSFWN